MKRRPFLSAAALLIGFAGSAQAVQLGLLDDFEAGPDQCTLDGWAVGGAASSQIDATVGCGELMTCCLSYESVGGFGGGSRQIIFNEAQWAGDYITAGVNRIQFQAANASVDETLNLRIGVTDGTTCYVSSDAIPLAPAAPGPDGLTFVSFYLDAAQMEEVSGNLCGGGATLDTVLGNVTQLRILSAASPQWRGDAIVSTLQVDAIQSKADSDFDGVNNDLDNCTAIANPDQIDADGDGYGNLCDADLNNDCITNPIDLGVFRSAFFGSDPVADLNSDGVVNPIDLGIFRSLFFAEPGPGLGSCGACVPPAPLGTNADFSGLPMFMRGGLVNDWGATDGLNSFSDQTGGLYVARFEMNAGDFEWKAADEGWSIEFCTTTNLEENTPTVAPIFGCAFPANGTITVPASGCYEFQMQTDGNIPPNEVTLTFSPD